LAAIAVEEKFFASGAVDRTDSVITELTGVISWSDFQVVDYDAAAKNSTADCPNARPTPSLASPENPIFQYQSSF
jgi:hypothetical protein